MKENLNKVELIELVRKIIKVDGSEQEIDEMINILEKNVPHPYISDLIFYPQKDKVTPEEIIEEALNYKPINL